jgi:threonine dehydrogenase-like Zn-dependent dehydrogenase
MKALVWKETGKIEKDLAWPTPEISNQEVLVRVQAAGVCMTDIHMLRGQLHFAVPPWILGHEMAGVIEQVGADIKGWAPGERVVIDPVVTCGSCHYCLIGKKYLCPSGGELGTTYGTGGYGQYVVVKPSNLYALPPELSFEEGALMEPLNCTLGAVDRVRDMVGADVIVFGPGPAGLLFVQLAKAYGALSVTLVGTRDEKLALGKQLGADTTINIRTSSLAAELEHSQFDVAIEASGNEQAISDCFETVRKSGTVVLYGLSGAKHPTINSDTIVSKDLTVVTCISAPLLWEKGIRLVQAGKINVRNMITHTVSFDDAPALLNTLVKKQEHPTKAVILHESYLRA